MKFDDKVEWLQQMEELKGILAQQLNDPTSNSMDDLSAYSDSVTVTWLQEDNNSLRVSILDSKSNFTIIVSVRTPREVPKSLK